MGAIVNFHVRHEMREKRRIAVPSQAILLNDMSGDLKKHVEDSRKLANLKLYVQSRGQVVLTVVLGDTR
jgi:hypothetical protein